MPFVRVEFGLSEIYKDFPDFPKDFKGFLKILRFSRTFVISWILEDFLGLFWNVHEIFGVICPWNPCTPTILQAWNSKG